MIATNFWDVIADGGAKGDGTTDDTAAIQAILNDAGAVRGAVYVPSTPAFFLISAWLQVPAGVRLIIDGTIKVAAGTGADMIFLSGSGITVEGKGVLDGNAANQPAGSTQAGMFTPAAPTVTTGLVIRGITIQNTTAWPLNLTSCSGALVDGVKLLNGGAANEFAEGCSDCWARNLQIDNIRDYGWCFYGGVTNSGISDSIIQNSTPCIGVLSDEGQTAPCVGITIADNICLQAATETQNACGLFVANNTGSTANDHSDIIIRGNRFRGSTGYPASTCVYIGSCSDVLFEGNQLHEMQSQYAITVDAAQRVRVQGNDIHNCAMGADPADGVGIDLTAASTSVLVEHNSIFQDAGQTEMVAATQDAGTGNRRRDNWEWQLGLDVSAYWYQRAAASLPGLTAGSAHSGTFTWPQPFFSTPNVFTSIDVLSGSEAWWDCVTVAVFDLTNTGGSFYVHNLGAGSTSGSGELVILGFAD